MKRLLPVALLALLAATGLSACNEDDAVVTVNGEDVLTQDDWQAELDEFHDSDDFLDALNVRGTGGDETLSSAALASVLSNHVLAPLVEEYLDQEDITITDQDRSTGENILTTVLANPNPDSGNAPIALEDMPVHYRDVLTEIYVGFTAAVRDLGANPEDNTDPNISTAQQTFSDAIAELRQAADIEIDARYGSWNDDPATPGVDPPEGPVAPATTIPLTAATAGG